MVAMEKDLKERIIQSQGRLTEGILREAVEAVEQFNTKAANFREAYGTTIDDDDDQWRRLTGDTRRDLAPMTQKRMQDMALYLWESNLLANRIVELTIAYLFAEGVRVVADDEIIQEHVDRFWHDPINQMDLKLPQKARELSLFGEQCWPVFVNEFNGHVRLGYLDPTLIETVVTDPDNAEQPIGIVTVKNKKGRARRYQVIVNGPDEDLFTRRTQEIRQTFEDGQCFYFNINKLSNGQRGRSDLLAQIDWLDAYDQYLFGEIDRSMFMRAFMWDVELSNATPDEVEERARKIAPPKPGSVRVHNDSEKWTAVAPDLKAQDGETNARLFRNHILGGATMPEHWYGGGGDVNRATAGEMGDPTYKMMTMRQTTVGHILEAVLRFVIRMKERSIMGREPDTFDPVYNFRVQWPELVSRDLTKYAAALTQVTMGVGQLIREGLLTRERALQIVEKIAARLGVEFDVTEELEKAMKELDVENSKDVFNDLPKDKDDDDE
ncbi:MAG: hypothetical protein SV201_04975 [Pseudomonadota bacterium]|nr:hypothetical protein [Pseudomonadota bacterium]